MSRIEQAFEQAARQTARDMTVIAVVSFCAGVGLAILFGALT